MVGLRVFGLLGLLIGPLAISYFFELTRMYRKEYLEEEEAELASEPMAVLPRTTEPLSP